MRASDDSGNKFSDEERKSLKKLLSRITCELTLDNLVNDPGRFKEAVNLSIAILSTLREG